MDESTTSPDLKSGRAVSVEREAQIPYSARDIPVARFNPAKWITRCNPFGRESGGWGSRRTDSREGATPWRESTAPLLLPFFSLTAWICVFFFDSPYFSLLFFPAVIPHHLVDGTNAIRPASLEVLEVQLFDKLRQRQLPGFLIRVGQASELLRIQPQFSGHLDVGMGKMVAFPRIDPSLIFFRYLILLCQGTCTYRFSIW